MKITTFLNVLDRDAGNVFELKSLKDLFDQFRPISFSGPKERVPCWSPTIFDGTRSLTNAVEVHAAVLDIDHSTYEAVGQVQKLLERWGYIVYTTYSHGKDLSEVCCRFVVPFSSAAPAEIWSRVWDGIYRYLEKIPDPACKDASRLYLIPATTPERFDQAGSILHPGPAMDPREFLIAANPLTMRREALSREGLSALVVTLMSSSQSYRRSLGKVLERTLQGIPWAPQGQRDTTLFKLIGLLLEKFPGATEEQICSLFEPSVNSMRHEPGAPTLREVAEKTKRLQTYAQIQQEQDLDTNTAQQTRNGQIKCYGADDLAAMAVEPRSWIVQKGSGYFVRSRHDYVGPYCTEEAQNAILEVLAPAVSAGVVLWQTGAQGEPLPLSLSEMVRQYGTVADELIGSLIEKTSSFDEKTKTFTQAQTPRRQIKPKYDPAIQDWINLLGGDQAENLTRWLALVPDLTQPLVAVFLSGAPSAGKSMLARGIGRLWINAVTDAKNAMHENFNDQIVKNPIVFADESFPTDLRGRAKLSELRRITQSRTQDLKRKYLGTVQLDGCLRLIIAANNADLLRTDEHLTDDDVQAISERVMHLPVDKKPGQYLTTLPEGTFDQWVEGDGIAAHCLALQESGKYQAQGRFGVIPDSHDIAVMLAVRTGTRSDLCQWVAQYLLRPESVGGEGVRVINGQIQITPAAVLKYWVALTGHNKPPTISRVAEALQALCHQVDTPGDQTYYEMSLPMLRAWCNWTGFVKPTSIEGLLQKIENKKLTRIRG